MSSEWLFPRLWQTLEEAPEVYGAADRFIDVADWLVQRLTGTDTRAEGIAGYKYFWGKAEGYPPEGWLAALNPRLAGAAREKLRGTLRPIGGRAGGLTAEGARLTGLLPGTAVAVGNIDAHVSMPSVGPTGPGDYLMIIGTSSCHIWNCLGVFPVTGQDLMLIGFPKYEKSVLHLHNGNTFVIEKEGTGIYTKKATLNGEELPDLRFAASEMMKGGTLRIVCEETA